MIASADPGANLFVKAFDQAGNWAVCDVKGVQRQTSDLTQVTPTIAEDVTPPTIGPINIPPGGQTITASWTGSDDKTPAAQIYYIYAIDLPFDQWTDPQINFVGQVNSVTVDVSALTEGQHTFYLAALDQEGNVGLGSQSFTIDRTPPDVAVADACGSFAGSESRRCRRRRGGAPAGGGRGLLGGSEGRRRSHGRLGVRTNVGA